MVLWSERARAIFSPHLLTSDAITGLVAGVRRAADNRKMVNRVFLEHIKTGLAPFQAQLVCAYLFGSQARGDAKPASDVDVAILFRQDPPRSLDGLGLNIAGAIEAELGQQVDLVVLNRASPDLVHRVLRESVLLLETDRAARVKFEHRARSEYFDVLPYLREYRRASGGSS